MSFESTSPLDSAGVTSDIRGTIRESSLCATRAGVNIWASDRDIVRLSTWQLQQLRRVARAHARLPWRDNQMRAQDVLDLTRIELQRRGAWSTYTASHGWGLRA